MVVFPPIISTTVHRNTDGHSAILTGNSCVNTGVSSDIDQGSVPLSVNGASVVSLTLSLFVSLSRLMSLSNRDL